MEQQLSLFDQIPQEEIRAEEPTCPKEIEDMCLIYLVTRGGGNQGNVWILNKEDAMRFCEDECSHGQSRGGRWMFCWTSLKHFWNDDAASAQHKNVHGKLEPFVFIKDTGKQDKDLERLGIIKPTIREVEEMLNQMGYELKFK